MLLGRGTAGFALTCSLLLPGAAQAQDSPRPDPDSPAGVEYQLPLDRARDEAAPDRDDGDDGAGPGGGDSGGPAPLFGAGIREKGSDAPSRGETDGGGSTGDGDQEAVGTGGGNARGGDGGSAPSFETTAAEGGGSTDLTLAGIALAVVVGGGALGLALRRGLGTTHAS